MKKLRIILIPVFLAGLFLAESGIVSANVLINEFSVQPEDKQDWVELYSPDTIDISGWKVADDKGVFEVIPQGTVLGPSVYYVVSQFQRLNNQNDSVYLKNMADEVQDSITYGGAEQVCTPGTTESIARIPDGGNTYDRVSTPTRGSSNNSATLYPCPSPTPVPTDVPNTPVPTNTPIPTNAPPTSTPRPTATPTKKVSPTPIDNSTKNALLQEQANLSNFRYSSDEDKLNAEDVLGISKDDISQRGNFSPFAYVLFGLGVIFIGVSVFLFVKHRKRE